MNLTIRPVTSENRREVLALSVQETQKGFIETTAQCLEEADSLPLWRPVGLYDGELLVGFAMYGFWKYEGRDGRVWLDRLLIDRRYQGRGYGKAALQTLLARIRREYDRPAVYLSLYAENAVAARLYERFGFRYNGELDQHGERVMVLDFAAANDPALRA